jgi:hypothetical protein
VGGGHVNVLVVFEERVKQAFGDVVRVGVEFAPEADFGLQAGFYLLAEWLIGFEPIRGLEPVFCADKAFPGVVSLRAPAEFVLAVPAEIGDRVPGSVLLIAGDGKAYGHFCINAASSEKELRSLLVGSLVNV